MTIPMTNLGRHIHNDDLEFSGFMERAGARYHLGDEFYFLDSADDTADHAADERFDCCSFAAADDNDDYKKNEIIP